VAVPTSRDPPCPGAPPPESLPEPFRAGAAVSIVLREPPAGLEVLFIRRGRAGRDLWSGHVAFPGPVEPGEGNESGDPETEEESGST